MRGGRNTGNGWGLLLDTSHFLAQNGIVNRYVGPVAHQDYFGQSSLLLGASRLVCAMQALVRAAQLLS
ncbi:hypothetical protein A8E25_34025 [Burkholderia cenocepacia]|jgi:hypothetical protein|nr:hypothetical protein A2T82_31005 [Burkholderia cenocepacia]KIS51775.1 hypothetical protein NP88_99 [Burkholderia cepacia]AMU18568.1 hypothetical protein A3203_35810 [Burkholderia cenocepacia]KKI82310.1 hypothetical protein WQ49_08710 [Burkholderia cenocepacia]NGO98135.1 hypothetical protein [Burkholderia cenocepacia]